MMPTTPRGTCSTVACFPGKMRGLRWTRSAPIAWRTTRVHPATASTGANASLKRPSTGLAHLVAREKHGLRARIGASHAQRGRAPPRVRRREGATRSPGRCARAPRGAGPRKPPDRPRCFAEFRGWCEARSCRPPSLAPPSGSASALSGLWAGVGRASRPIAVENLLIQGRRKAGSGCCVRPPLGIKVRCVRRQMRKRRTGVTEATVAWVTRADGSVERRQLA